MKKIRIAGFSLVEVLVAAAIVSFSLISVVGFVRKGNVNIALDKHRRTARGIVERTLEQPTYQPENYKNLVTIASPAPIDTIIDKSANLHGKLSVAVSDSVRPTYGGITTTYRAVTATVAWLEAGPGVDSEKVSMQKWLTNIQRQ
jgi:prepilin-type N-terminal cleavage/methylation domain-containing protein